VLALRCGLRAESILNVRIDQDIPENSSSRLVISIPEKKTGCQKAHEQVLTGVNAEVVRA
jgi:hypothetical protein